MSNSEQELIEIQEAGEADYLDFKTKDLLEAFGSGNHIPGSGSAAILSALIGIEMMKTVLQLSLGKDQYKEKWDEFKHILNLINEQYKPKLIEFFHSDIKEFHKVSYARRKRDNAEIGSKERDKLGREASEQLKIATEIPIEICEISFKLLEHAIYTFDNGFKSAKGDSGVSISNLLSAISGSLFIIFLNLKSFKKAKWKDDKMNTAVQLAKQYTEIQRLAYSKVVEMYNESSNDEEPQLKFDF